MRGGSKERRKGVDLPNLRRTRHSPVVVAPAIGKQVEGIINVCEEMTVEKISSENGAGSTFARKTVDYSNISRITAQPIMNLVDYFEHLYQIRWMMIRKATPVDHLGVCGRFFLSPDKFFLRSWGEEEEDRT